MVIPDVSLPNQNGLDLLQIMKRKWPVLNVLMYSMHLREQ
ncbi:MAG: response regulator [Bacteroidales bacterium]|nr:response regulator [Bacteroidales bacterium]